MPKGSRQREMFRRSRRPLIEVDSHHPLVLLADYLDWTGLEETAQTIRKKKLKNMAGRKPKLRALIGAVILMGIRSLTYREAEDFIRYYGPARYLCGLTESNWTPDFTTIQDFTQLMGEDGVRLLNEAAVRFAVQEGFANPKIAVADLTTQEAAIPYPTEVGWMSSFMSSVMSATKQAGGALKKFSQSAQRIVKKAKKKIREYRLFEKTAEGKTKCTEEWVEMTETLTRRLKKAVSAGEKGMGRLKKDAKVAHRKAGQLCSVMMDLLPQIKSWLKTGKVAKGKILNLFMPELRSHVRGKVGKKVEFGFMWGVERLSGGYVLGRMSQPGECLHDTQYVLEAVETHKEMFGKAPLLYGYDRGGHREKIPEKLRKMGVKYVGVAPRGNAKWEVSGKIKKKIISERSKVEGSIGTAKSKKYGFNRPGARTHNTMGACGQRAFLGMNLNKLIRDVAKKQEIILEC